jgi:ubiquinone/menaquinone biosynthesis C-methylase UbiE
MIKDTLGLAESASLALDVACGIGKRRMALDQTARGYGAVASLRT